MGSVKRCSEWVPERQETQIPRGRIDSCSFVVKRGRIWVGYEVWASATCIRRQRASWPQSRPVNKKSNNPSTSKQRTLSDPRIADFQLNARRAKMMWQPDYRIELRAAPTVHEITREEVPVSNWRRGDPMPCEIHDTTSEYHAIGPEATHPFAVPTPPGRPGPPGGASIRSPVRAGR